MKGSMRSRILRTLVYFVTELGASHLVLALVIWTMVDRWFVYAVDISFDWYDSAGFNKVRAVYSVLVHCGPSQPAFANSEGARHPNWETSWFSWASLCFGSTEEGAAT